MRILAVTVSSVGGLADGRVALPSGPITALAGANGTGKSKLLACILAPWTGQIPAPRREDAIAEAMVELELTEGEIEALKSYSLTIGWGPAEIPEVVQVGVRRGPIIGQQRKSEPNITVLANAWSNAEFLALQPSLDVVFLPAERRLLEPRRAGIDLNQLSEAMAFAKTAESRNAVANYGRLDDQEFEDFAKALCVAASLPADDEEGQEPQRPISRIGWQAFQETVNALIAPKMLMGLTTGHPDKLRIKTPGDDVHAVSDLSSGERQALIIMSRILRAGARAPIVMIDEPDAYLHPNLSKRLILALEEGVGDAGQLIVATHSPSILDGIPPASILRLEHGGPPQPVADESDRLELYRSAGFRSSAFTQSDLLVLTEGATDASILSLAIPELSRASTLPMNGRAQVLREVELLMPFDLPVIGVIDRDLHLEGVPAPVQSSVFAWPAADIEGVYLGSSEALQVMIDHGMIKTSHASIDALTKLIDELCSAQRENVIAEIARARAVKMSGYEWPSPRGDEPLKRLREAVQAATPISAQALENAITDAEAVWDAAAGERLTVVRGKYILSSFTSAASEMKAGRALIEATARHRPAVPAVIELTAIVNERLKLAP